ncbi:MAG TPA: AAA family ATPase, partial [Chitinophagaceae bacterium]|nr:AAA family ATPase [Chitinophagaceae bacterium]
MKTQTSFFCQQCGNESPKWQGKCPYCHAWNTLVEEIKVKSKKSDSRTLGFDSAEPKQSLLLEEIEGTDLPRILTADPELNRVLGGGLVPGSVILVAGEPGIGKSTLFLQDSLMMTSTRVLYVSGEESLQQIKLRAQRLQLKNNDFYLFTTTQTTALLNEVKRLKPGLLIIDSIQTLESSSVESAPGSVSQVRECTAEIVRYAKSQHVPVIIIGH